MFNNDTVSGGVLAWLAATFIALVVVILLLLASTIYPSLGTPGLIALFQIGLWQWLYLIPLIVWLRRRNRSELAKGVTIAACIAFGLNALCSGLLFFSSR